MSDNRRGLNSLDDIAFAVRRIEELEAKLEKAVEALSYYANHEILIQYDDASTAQDTLAELKGQSHD